MEGQFQSAVLSAEPADIQQGLAKDKTEELCVTSVTNLGTKSTKYCVLCKGCDLQKGDMAHNPGSGRWQVRVTESEKPSTMIHILQANMHRSATAHVLKGQLV